MLLPLAALLNGIGYVFIARLDRASSPACRRRGPLVGIGAYIAHARRRAPASATSSATATRSLLIGIGAAAAAARARRRPRRSTARGSGSSSGRSTSSPASSPRSCWPSSSPPTSSRSASCSAWRRGRVGPLAAARPEAPRPGAAGLGRLARGHDRREGPRLVAAVLRPVRRDAVGRDRAGRATSASARVLFAVGAVRARGTPFAHVQDRVDDLARTRGPTPSARASRSSRRCSPWLGRRHRHRPRPRQPRHASPWSRPTSSSPPSARSSACSAPPPSSSPSC